VYYVSCRCQQSLSRVEHSLSEEEFGVQTVEQRQRGGVDVDVDVDVDDDGREEDSKRQLRLAIEKKEAQ
jgi:hypothetical protein